MLKVFAVPALPSVGGSFDVSVLCVKMIDEKAVHTVFGAAQVYWL